jgi:hypothetical protein
MHHRCLTASKYENWVTAPSRIFSALCPSRNYLIAVPQMVELRHS